MKTNQQKVIELLEEEAVEVPKCREFDCKNAALPDQKSCEVHTLVGKVPGLGDEQKSSQQAPEPWEDEDNPIPKRTGKCPQCSEEGWDGWPSKCKGCGYRLTPQPTNGHAKDAAGMPISGTKRRETLKSTAQAKIPVPDLSDPNDISLKPGEYSMVRRNGTDGVTHIIGIRLSDVKSRAMRFIWPGRIPAGKGVVVQGMPGKGKSMAILDWAARITRGWDWPDGAKNEMGPKQVIWAGTEDDLEDTVKPRLQALGADMTKIHAVKRVATTEGGLQQRRLLLRNDIKALYKLLNENQEIALVIFDPITGFYGGADGNSSKEIRPIMEQLAEVSRNTGVTIVAIMHENRRKDVTALERVLGSGAVGQVFRVAFRFSEDPKNKGGYVMACSKTNFKTKGGLRYTIQDCKVRLDDGTESQDIGKVVWGETHDLSADDVLAQQAEEQGQTAKITEVSKAEEIFKRELADGRRLCRDVHRVFDAANIDKNARDRAKWQLNIKTIGKAPGPYWWELPGETRVEEGIYIPDPTIPDHAAL